jgi:hypothetical protein
MKARDMKANKAAPVPAPKEFIAQTVALPTELLAFFQAMPKITASLALEVKRIADRLEQLEDFSNLAFADDEACSCGVDGCDCKDFCCPACGSLDVYELAFVEAEELTERPYSEFLCASCRHPFELVDVKDAALKKTGVDADSAPAPEPEPEAEAEEKPKRSRKKKEPEITEPEAEE